MNPYKVADPARPSASKLPISPESAALMFSEPKIGVPFGLVMCAGLFLCGAVYLLRPWPPSASRATMVFILGVLSTLLAGALLLKTEIVLDAAQARIVESRTVLGIGPRTQWPFSDITAIVVAPLNNPALNSAGGFNVALDLGEHRLHLQNFDRVLPSENLARELASFTGAEAQRDGYSMVILASGGDSRAFLTSDGREGVSLALDSMVQLRATPGRTNPIPPLP